MDFLSFYAWAITLIFCIHLTQMSSINNNIPVVVNTWAFTNGTARAWDVIMKKQSALDAVEAGCSQCEDEQCDHTVGFGGSPDENGETTLDAMIFDGATHDMGAVAALRRVKHAISVARKVLENTEHSLLVGDQATQFALKMGFKEENLSTPYSVKVWKDWKDNKCQPNFWKNVTPNPKESCGPYKSISSNKTSEKFHHPSHDTIGMIAIDHKQNIAAGTSSNGATHKIPGRVGDSPIPGAGAYVDKDVGGAVATGDGDVMMRFVPTFNTVENMRRGMSATEAAEDSIRRIVLKYPSFSGAVVALNIKGDFGAACHNIPGGKFPFSVANSNYGAVVVKSIPCIGVQ